MKVKRTLTIEIDRVKITTNFNHNKHLWCEICQREAEFITGKEAFELAKAMKAQGLHIKKENLHLLGATDSEMMVCLGSIINSSNNLQIY